MTLHLFLSLLSTRSPSVVCRELGVDRVTVCRWRSGARKPNKTVLILAELLWRGPRELPAGLPVDDQGQAG